MLKHRVSVHLGSLTEDLRVVARSVIRASRRRMLVVWVDHQNAVFGDIPSQVIHAPPDWIVGTYQGCKDEQVIRDDLMHFVASRGIAPGLDGRGSDATGDYV